MSSYPIRSTPGDTAWFRAARFGMFIHWGLYALPARHEWVKTNEKISEEKYDQYFRHFDPDLYNAREWARMAKAAGMKYAVFTTKHHEGFCMFDSQYTDYKCTNTPAGRDLVREFVDASGPRACGSASTIPLSTGITPISPSIFTIPAGMIRTLSSKTRAGI
jgi:alpha-L-fucosidase